ERWPPRVLVGKLDRTAGGIELALDDSPVVEGRVQLALGASAIEPDEPYRPLLASQRRAQPVRALTRGCGGHHPRRAECREAYPLELRPPLASCRRFLRIHLAAGAGEAKNLRREVDRRGGPGGSVEAKGRREQPPAARIVAVEGPGGADGQRGPHRQRDPER